MTLLYLDDDRDDIGFFHLAAKLINNVEQIYTTSDPSEFFTLMENNHKGKTIIFLDINMPENGFQVLKKIRGRQGFEYVPVVMLSTSNDDATILLSKNLGATHYSVKPDSIDKLRKIIERAVNIFNGAENNNSFVISDSHK